MLFIMMDTDILVSYYYKQRITDIIKFRRFYINYNFIIISLLDTFKNTN